jgi:hypothetical protein
MRSMSAGSAARRAMKSKGSSTMCVVPSRYGGLQPIPDLPLRRDFLLPWRDCGARGARHCGHGHAPRARRRQRASQDQRPEAAVAAMIRVIDGLTLDRSGLPFDFEGKQMLS